MEVYSQCETKLDKSVLISALVEILRDRSPSGGFVKFSNAKMCYVRLKDRDARQKVAHALRNAMLARGVGGERHAYEKTEGSGSDDEMATS